MHPSICASCSSPLNPSLIFCEGCGALSAIDPLLGETIAQRYLVEKELGRGGFSLIYAAKDLITSRTVALKILRASRRDDSFAIGRFQRESMVCFKLKHPNITQVYDVGQDRENLFWISMELLVGETLEGHLQRHGSLSTEETLRLFSPLLGALDAAHQQGIVHRDLKPQNLFLAKNDDGTSTLKLLDFGIASFLEGETLTQNGSVAGSPPFMPPEQWEGLARTDARSDLYSLGVVMYWCLSGQLPFKASSALEWMKRHFYDQPLALCQAARLHPISLQLSAVVMRALQKRPEDRYQSALAFQEALLAVVGASTQDTLQDASSLSKTIEETASSPSAAPVSVPLPAGRSPLWLVGGALLLGSLVGLLHRC